ncbi:MAG: hypothetical protein ACR2JQ_08485 [Mycobacteriales bacterium]
MTWTWRYETADGGALDVPVPEAFATRSDAESWLGEAFPELIDRGVAQVSLLEDGQLRYGPMGLDPADG